MLAFKVAFIAYVYGVILTEPGMIAGYVYNFFEQRYGNIEHDWRFKFWLSCYKCISGQLASWIYPLFNPYRFESVSGTLKELFEHVFFVCLVIVITISYKKIHEKINNSFT
jgi:hypothetical protein